MAVIVRVNEGYIRNYHRIGQKIHYKGKTYVASKTIIQFSCTGCMLPIEICAKQICGSSRPDGKDVIFKFDEDE